MAEHNGDESHKELSKNTAVMGCFLDQDIEMAKSILLCANQHGKGIDLYERTEASIQDLKDDEDSAIKWLGLIAQIGWVTVLSSLGNSALQQAAQPEDTQ